jgi:hypothetical protein
MKTIPLFLAMFLLAACTSSEPSSKSTGRGGKADDLDPTKVTLTDFTCVERTVESWSNIAATLRFTVQNLADPKTIDFLWPENEDESPIKAEENTYAQQLSWDLVNGGISYDGSDLVVTGDGDGCQFEELHLYGNSAFKRGYFRFDGGYCSEKKEGFYTIVDCEVVRRVAAQQ